MKQMQDGPSALKPQVQHQNTGD